MRRRAVSLLLASVVAVATFGLAATPAQAANPTLTATYPVNGTTHINSTDSDLVLGPGSLHATLDLITGALVGSITLPPATGSFTEFGVIPVQATAEFTESVPTTGTADPATGAVQTESHVNIRLTSLKIAGLPVLVGDHCQTETPAIIDLASEPGFGILTGGVVSGTYTIPDFDHCLLATSIINLIIPGSGNTIALTLGRAVLGS
jgi:hypothetical protein